MKPFRINRNSWHYRMNTQLLNDSYSNRNWEDIHSNFCSYWRATVLRGSVLLVFLTLILSAVAFLVGAFILDPVGGAMTVGLILGLFALIALIATLVHYTRAAAQHFEQSPSIFVQRYRSVKSRFCPSIEYDK